MSIAFTFPGQGSQAVGMGKALADNFAEARAVFDEVDDALGEKLTAIIWDGPEETLTLTANAQPALMAVSIAVIRVLEARGVSIRDKVAYVAGHSLGEYSALCAAGTFSLADTARLLRIRGNAMQQAVPAGAGAMAAIIGLEHEVVAAVCADAALEGPVQIANDNGGGQIVISGSKAPVEAAAALEAEGIDIEVIDLRSIRPMDKQTIIDSVKKTSRLLCVYEAVKTLGIGAEISAAVAESDAFDYLDAPIVRLGGAEVPIPYNPELEKATVPQVPDIIAAARDLAKGKR